MSIINFYDFYAISSEVEYNRFKHIIIERKIFEGALGETECIKFIDNNVKFLYADSGKPFPCYFNLIRK